MPSPYDVEAFAYNAALRSRPGGTTDYEALTNKPSINGVELSGNKTSATLGIPTADDLDGKVDKDPGKGLSTEDFTTAEKDKLAHALTEHQDISSILSRLSAVETWQSEFERDMSGKSIITVSA